MPEYLSPGVYVEELSGAIKPIQGVSTSTTGFVGQTERGPVDPRLVTSWPMYERWFGGHIPETVSYLPYAVQGFFANGGQRLFIARVTRAGALTATMTVDTEAGDQQLNIMANGPGLWGGRVYVRLREGTKRLPGQFRLTLLYYRVTPPDPFIDPLDTSREAIAAETRREPDVVEDYDNLSADPLHAAYVTTVVNGASQLVRLEWVDNTLPPSPPAPNDGFTPLPVDDAADGAPVPTAADYLGDDSLPPNQRTGLAGLAVIDQISLLGIPDAVHPALAEAERNTLVGEIITQCDLLKDRFAILDVERNQGQVEEIQGLLPRRSSYAAIYYPWIRMLNPLTRDTLLVPPSGHIAGVYAWTDVNRGVHKAPANYELQAIINRDLSTGEGPLEFPITKGQHDILNPIGVNVIRDFRANNQGIRVWGARTLSADPEWIYVNVRRLFLYVEESVEEGLQWVVFEPNDHETWAKVRRSISAFLERVWRDGALFGTTPEEAFFVQCDRTTMTEDDILNGRLIVLIGIAPVRPAEFVILRFSQKTLEAAA
jgi:uncharacterized protein